MKCLRHRPFALKLGLDTYEDRKRAVQVGASYAADRDGLLELLGLTLQMRAEEEMWEEDHGQD